MANIHDRMENNKGDLALNAFVIQRRKVFAGLLRLRDLALLNQNVGFVSEIDLELGSRRKMFVRYEKTLLGRPDNVR
jgi:hypothetical protein